MERKRLTSLDALRGIAALAVVVWHWQHFFAISGAWMPGWSREMQPFYTVLKPLYLEGWAAVDLFFVLSGFVFFWLYGDAVRERAMGAGRFAWLRFSRLYPLHLVTLLAVAAMQIWFTRLHGGPFVYIENDLRRFVLHLFFVQSWSLEIRQNFNGPSWSVSLEVLLYILFFAACRFGLRARGAALIALASVPLYWVSIDLARAPVGFFMGGATVWAWQALRDRAVPMLGRAILGAAIAGWAVLYVALYRGWFDSGDDNIAFLAVFDFGLAPLTVLALALREQVRPAAGWLGALGDISYATYLLQFPLQLALAILATRLALTPQFFMQDWVMLAFFAVLIALGFASYHLFERPMQHRLRRFSLRETARAGG